MGEKTALGEQLENLKYTRDFELYLDVMGQLKDKYLIILCTKEASDPIISETAIAKIHSLGFSAFPMNFPLMYVGAADRGSVICDKASAAADEPVSFDETAGKAKLSVLSALDSAEITIDGANWSLDERGLNFAVYDPEKSEIVDVACYDAFAEVPTFYHRNFFYSDEYIADHIYMPEKYMDRVTRPMKKSYFSNRKLGVREVENGIILPNKIIDGKGYGGVCDESFNFIEGHHPFDAVHDDHSRNLVGSYTVPQEDIEYLDETVVYGGTMYNHPGHLIIECFADRIWWFLKNTDSRLKVACCVMWENTVSSWQKNKRSSEYAFFVKDFFKAFGMPEDRIVFVKKPMKFKKVIVPDQSSLPLTHAYPYDFTPEYSQVFQRMRDPNMTARYKKIYLAKTKSPRNDFINEEFFIDFYEKRGFEIIYPEDYDVKEQAEFLYGADEVAALDGTLANMSIFCKPTAKFTVLGKMFSSYDSSVLRSGEVSGAEVFLVNISGSFFNFFSEIKDIGVYATLFGLNLSLLCVTEEFRKYVKYYFNEELDITPEESLKSHLYEYLRRLPEHFLYDQSRYNTIKNLTVTEVMQNISEVFFRKEIDTSHLKLITSEVLLANKQRNELNLEKADHLTSLAKELTDENAALKLRIADLETEIKRLRSG